jgi:hypothetical protein
MFKVRVLKESEALVWLTLLVPPARSELSGVGLDQGISPNRVVAVSLGLGWTDRGNWHRRPHVA